MEDPQWCFYVLTVLSRGLSDKPRSHLSLFPVCLARLVRLSVCLISPSIRLSCVFSLSLPAARRMNEEHALIAAYVNRLQTSPPWVVGWPGLSGGVSGCVCLRVFSDGVCLSGGVCVDVFEGWCGCVWGVVWVCLRGGLAGVQGQIGLALEVCGIMWNCTDIFYIKGKVQNIERKL